MANVAVNASPNDVDFNNTDEWVEVTMMGDTVRQYVPAVPNQQPKATAVLRMSRDPNHPDDTSDGWVVLNEELLGPLGLEPSVCSYELQRAVLSQFGMDDAWSGNLGMIQGVPPRQRDDFARQADWHAGADCGNPPDLSWLRADWYWYVGLAAVVALGVGSAWL